MAFGRGSSRWSTSDRLGEAWRALERHSEPSFFRSWGWIGCWLRHLPAGRQPLAAIATKGAEIVGLGVFVPVRQRRHWIIPARTLRLHESGEPALDALFIEHNGLVADRAHASAVWAAMLGLLGRGGTWDEVVLGGLEHHTAELSIEAARARRRPVIVRAQRRAAHLDLAALRRSGRRLADALSRNTRHQLMRTRRLYAAIGPLSLRAARTADEALAMLEQLKALHQKSWRRRGEPGCFATPIFETFHRDPDPRPLPPRRDPAPVRGGRERRRSAISTISPTAIGSTLTRAASTTPPTAG